MNRLVNRRPFASPSVGWENGVRGHHGHRCLGDVKARIGEVPARRCGFEGYSLVGLSERVDVCIPRRSYLGLR